MGVHLDGKYEPISARVTELFDGRAEGLVDLGQPVLDDLGKAEQDRVLDALPGDLSDNLYQVGALLPVPSGADLQVALFVYGEVTSAPVIQTVETAGVIDRPHPTSFIKIGSTRRYDYLIPK